MIYNNQEFIYYRDIMNLYPNIKFEYGLTKTIFNVIKNTTNEIVCDNIEYYIINGRLYVREEYFNNTIKPILNNLPM